MKEGLISFDLAFLLSCRMSTRVFVCVFVCVCMCCNSDPKRNQATILISRTQQATSAELPKGTTQHNEDEGAVGAAERDRARRSL